MDYAESFGGTFKAIEWQRDHHQFFFWVHFFWNLFFKSLAQKRPGGSVIDISNFQPTYLWNTASFSLKFGIFQKKNKKNIFSDSNLVYRI